MLKKIEYETKNIDEVVLDLAEEIKNGWSIYSYGAVNMDFSIHCDPHFTVEVALIKEFKNDQ